MTTTAPVLPEVDTTALYEIEEKVVTSVSLADLIRKGSQDSAQSVGWGREASSCALGAAGRAALDLGIV